MTRKPLTTNERAHGARAYSHNASRRAHQLSGPRRERVVCRPRGEPAVNSMTNGGRIWETACDCGFVICAKRGPCAPVVEAPKRARATLMCPMCDVERDRPCVECAPKPSPAPVVERPRFEVGDRVRCINSRILTIGETYTISRIGGTQHHGETQGNVQVAEHGGWYMPSRFEPVDPLTSERGAQESESNA